VDGRKHYDASKGNRVSACGMDSVVRDSAQWRVLVKTVMKLRVP
jgi:hypothetical protein